MAVGSEFTEVEVCIDCTYLAANGGYMDCLTEGERELHKKNFNPGGHLLPGEPLGFSWASCDTCGTKLGGDRWSGVVHIERENENE